MSKVPPFKAGERVRWDAFGVDGRMSGTVLKVSPKSISTGGSRWRVRVRWDSGSTSTVDDRVLKAVP